MTAKNGKQTLSGYLAHFAGEIDHRDHHGKRHRGGPEKFVSELRASLRVSADCRAVVVSGSGDQTETERAKNAFPALEFWEARHDGDSRFQLQRDWTGT